MAKAKNDPAVTGFQPIEVEAYVDQMFAPIEVIPYEPVADAAQVAAPAPATPVQTPAAG